MRFRLAIAALALQCSPLWADPPAGYYDGVDASSPAALRASLHAVIRDHTRIPITRVVSDNLGLCEALSRATP